jgi:hypothetical protein
MTDRSFERANDESRARLAILVETLTPEQLAVDLGSGWTVASALAHTGFWDRWQAERWTQVLAGTWSADDQSVVDAEHLANEALHPYWAAIDAEDVPALALEAATRLDSMIAAAPDGVIDAIEATPAAYMIHRHRHRMDHVDHIERTIAAARTSGPPQAVVQADRSYVERNEESRRRLRSVVAGLTAADLGRVPAPTEEGSWTIGQILGHLAFWDRFRASLWRSAQAAGPDRAPVDLPSDFSEKINLGLSSLIAAFASDSGDGLLREVVAAAEEVDSVIAGLPAEAPIAAILADHPSLLDRSMHRNQHVDQIGRG